MLVFFAARGDGFVALGRKEEGFRQLPDSAPALALVGCPSPAVLLSITGILTLASVWQPHPEVTVTTRFLRET